MRRAFRMSAGLAIAAIATLSFGVFAADPFTKDEAVAMVKKAVAAIKAEGPEKAYSEIDDKDPDGKAFVKERVELAKAQPSFWQSYKFMNPVTKTIEPKQMYCERLDERAICDGIYQ